ncbi:MAG: hypothetical protein QF755_05685 [Candidatus Peribacteraceae bacterium]|nr:hypothetical protein [Candidatus Peribacteraceae bacterium]
MAEYSESQDGEQTEFIAGMSKEEFAARFEEVTGKKLNLKGEVSPDLLRDLQGISLSNADDLPPDQVQANEDLEKLVQRLEEEGRI